VIFAIGDVHGCADELAQLLNQLPRTPETTIVFLGDYVDRGPDSRRVIEMLLELRQHCTVIPLKGNHEAMFLDYIRDPSSKDAALFVLNGGSATLASYVDAKGEVSIPGEHVTLLESLPLLHESDDYVFVHAGLPQLPLREISDNLKHHEELILWTRGKFLKTSYDWGKVVVHGHTPVPRVTQWPNRINIDTGCVFSGRLTALALPGEQRFSVKRMRQDQRILLRDPSGTREAHRFAGNVPVSVTRGEQVLQFVTVDYSELGMYIRAVDSDENLRYREGDKLVGVIGPDSLSPIRFIGVIVRRRVDDTGVHYGVKILESQAMVAQ
jgi:serine/threonine protein phosphatase 1